MKTQIFRKLSFMKIEIKCHLFFFGQHKQIVATQLEKFECISFNRLKLFDGQLIKH